MRQILRKHAVLARLVIVSLLACTGIVLADHNFSNIVETPTEEHWAWNDAIGWINFHETDTIVVSNDKIIGYASSSAGDISLDCATTRSGDLCPLGESDPLFYRVLNDGCGKLSGWGWNDTYGWVSFCGTAATGTPNCPHVDAPSGYGVSINATTREFEGYAWNDVAGWMSFNCLDPGLCGTSPYKVKTTWVATPTVGWVDSTIYDTGVANAQLNSVMWRGDMGVSSCPGDDWLNVAFQFAAANSTGSLTFIGPGGSSSTGDVYDALEGDPVPLNFVYHRGRYFQYRMILTSDLGKQISPRVDEVIVNWSP